MLGNSLLRPGFWSGLFLIGGVLATPLPSSSTSSSSCAAATTAANSNSSLSCGDNGPTNRACWKNNWDINTDYETTIPTGVNRTYDLTITNITSFAPDGVAKSVMLINGVYPGPPIIADWGDYLQITVHNELSDNGTSFHWHGIRQLNSSVMDGVNGVTECPTPPGSSKTYSFRAEQYGTSWYHSHFSVQYGNGAVGAIQINGPASANYDIDLGTYPISDWYHITADEAQFIAQNASGGPPPSDNILFNGTNINPNGTGGQYSRVTLTPGKKHRLRIINTSVENHFTVSLVGHNFTVIETDFVPVQPVVMDQLFVAVGQRYDVIIDASQDVDNYWFNATLASSKLCGSSKNTSPAAIFSYQGASDGLPTYEGLAISADCNDTVGFTPVVTRTAPQDQFTANEQDLSLNLTEPIIGAGSVFRWTINSSSMDVNWDKPILQYVQEGNTSYPTAANVVEIDEAGVWTFWVIQNDFGVLPHPIHLHGHDFLVLGSGDSGRFDAATDAASLNFCNPIRRDVAMLPRGWLAIAFRTDNPGAWLMHCHIAWHAAQGLSVQFLEMRSQIAAAVDLSALQPICSSWDTYDKGAVYPKMDSGI